MTTPSASPPASAIKFEYLNRVGSDPLTRDQTQGHRLHQPEHRINTIDPMTGDDIDDVTHHPSPEDGDLTVYSKSEATRVSDVDIPLDHPSARLPFPASDNGDRGG